MSDALHQALLRIEAFPGERGPVTFRETHISRLYFTAEHVYKLKKAVDFGFLRFSTLADRQHFCHEELRLNQRLCPSAYLRVATIRRQEERYTIEGPGIEGPGEVVDFAVVMRRLPEERMLHHLIASQDPQLPVEMERLARRLGAFHRQAQICREGVGSDLERVRQNWRENFIQTQGQIGRQLPPQAHDRCQRYADAFLQDNATLLRRREEQGMVRDGHGDLHCEHVCLTKEICIYDCIEFNRRFRVADIAADLAFLLMDLDFCGRRDLGQRLLTHYLAGTAGDRDLPRLLPFYKLYRAFVRGKVEGFLADDDAATAIARQEAAARARRYFSLALGYLAPQTLVVTTGLMGVGKSIVAAALGQALGAVLLRSDQMRKELAGRPATEPSNEPFHRGIYAPAFSKRTYQALLEAAGQHLAAGHRVVVDAAFARQEDREEFRQLAKQAQVPFLLVHMQCDRQTQLRRLDERQRRGGDPSDGREELLAAQADIFAPIAAGDDVINIDSTGEVDYNTQLILCRLAP